MMYAHKTVPATMWLSLFSITVLVFPATVSTTTPRSATAESVTLSQASDLYSQIILSTDPRIRPIQNQSAAVEVSISASILSLLAVDEVKQSISLNLLIRLSWTDETRRWDPSTYGGLNVVDVAIGDIWIPKLLTGNSVSKRDTFGTDYAPLSISNTGRVIHLPGGIMHTGCSLDMTYYPFDSQTCSVQLVSGSAIAFLQFVSYSNRMEKNAYIENPEWSLLDTSLVIEQAQGTSVAEFEIYIKRKPSHFILTILVPINIVSGLSSLVFLTPIDSGERVSFSVTVLLALSVYTSEVSKGLPNNSDTVPLMVIYLACLLLHAAAAIIVNLVALMRYHSNNQSNMQSWNSSSLKLIHESGRRKEIENDIHDSDYISLSEGQFPDLDNASGAKLEHRGEIGRSADTKNPPAVSSGISSVSSTKGRPWTFSFSSMFVACARKFNYGETDFRSSMAYERSEQDGHDVQYPWVLQKLLMWLLQFVNLLDFIMFVVFFSAWLIITSTFMTMFNQG